MKIAEIPSAVLRFQYQIAALSKAAQLDTTATRNREQAETKLAASAMKWWTPTRR